MDALVMAGGRGTRMDTAREKPLVCVGGRPMVDRVVDALGDSTLDTVHAAVSPHAPETATHLADRPVETIETPGDGYVSDLQYALDRVETPALTVAADLALLDGDVVDTILDVYRDADAGSLTVAVPAALKDLLGLRYQHTFDDSAGDGSGPLVPTGVNVVGDGDAEWTHCSYDARLAVNVNRQSDIAVAEQLL